MVRKLVLAVAAASALMSSSVVLALGVGDINLRSSLNQPLDAEIELLQVRDLSSQEIISALATPDEFGRAGIERIFFLNDLTFTPVIRADGKSVIRVTSSRPVREPFLNFLMEVRWPSGRVLREFTLLLDPPLYDPGPVVASAPVSQPQVQPRAQPQVQPARPSQAQPSGAGASSALGAQPAEPLYQAPAEQSSGQIRTDTSDTLWEIALRHRPQGSSVHQTMLAIQDLNPDAFIGGNINRLRAGQTLTLPDATQTTGRSQSEAVAQVAAQNASWQQGRQAPEPAQRQLDARRLDEAAAAPQRANNGDALRLVGSGEEQKDGGADAGSRNGAGELRDELDTTKEELDSVRREKAEAESRLSDMQSQMETLQRLLELKDEQLAAMQQAMGDSDELPESTTEASIASVEESAPEAVEEAGQVVGGESAADTQLALQADPDAPDAGDSTETAEIATTEEVSQEDLAPAVDSEPAADAESAPQAQEAAEEIEEPVAAEQGTMSLLQRMMQNQTFLLAGGGLVLLLLLLVLMAVARRNARREEDMADNFIARAAQNNDQDTDDSDQFNVALAGFQEEETSEQSLAEDPLVEADALIAYGKLDKAADVLGAAIDQEPERTDLRLKLMEVNGLLDDAQGYAEQEDILRHNGTVDNQIDMLNVRFPAMAAALASAAVSAEEYPEWDEDFLKESESATVENKPAESDKPEAEAAAEEYDFSGFDVEAEPAARQEPVAEESLEDFDLDFDLDDSLAESLAQTETTVSASKEETEDDFEFNFNLDETTTEPATVDTTPAGKTDDDEFTLDEDFDLSLTDEMESLKDADLQSESKPDTELEPMEEEQTVALSDSELGAFDLELDASMDEPEAELEADEVQLAEADGPDTAKAAPVDEGDDEDEFDFLSGTDESATKLDLARAYIDMGDSEGARDILTEVLEEGNEQQQQEAREMMEQLD
ncbi:FimV/HubP family polar landmark protein [Halopseudomonas salina]|uniref:Peptidoglycan-binding protein n=1 Tax=Halopseudomonas salina TaxID=1323744 RepID=A0ABQ1PZR9_9GAMM|nr:FimV/HubP family polar landmark protein [Halopseudomonas salina]GGD08672.1 peptidoglycan-binding protein [Halopseudomonas salina]